MSILTSLLAWFAAAEKTPAGEAAASTIGADVAAAAAGVKFVSDLAAHKATITEGLTAGLSLDKALAPVLPAQVESEIALSISLAEALTALYEAFPPGWQLIKVNHGPAKAVFGNQPGFYDNINRRNVK